MTIQNDTILFSSGKILYANNGIVGIDPDLNLSEGYDGKIRQCQITSKESLELAEYMIKKWSEFKANISRKCANKRMNTDARRRA
jgi:hypothetical protein